jgi:hypothetical protein
LLLRRTILYFQFECWSKKVPQVRGPNSIMVIMLCVTVGLFVCAGVGVVSVSRTAIGDTQHGYTWSVTFTTAIGNIDQMTVTSFLTGLKANVTVHTATQGNELGGYFTLTYLNHTSQPISVRESAQNVQRILMNMPPVSTAYVVRNDPTNNCDDGLCPNGPFLSRYEHCIHVSVSSKRVR